MAVQHHNHHSETPKTPGHHADHNSGHSGHADVFRRRFWISFLLTILIVLYSEMIQDWLRFTTPEFSGSNLIGPVLGTIVFIYGGPFSSPVAGTKFASANPA